MVRDLLSRMIMFNPDPVCVLDKSFRLIAVNEPFCVLLGQSIPQVLNKTIDQVVSGFADTDQVLTSLRLLLDKSHMEDEFILPFHSSDISGSLSMVISPLASEPDNSCNLSLFIIHVRKTEMKPGRPYIPATTSLIRIIHEVLFFTRDFGYSERTIQHLLSRIGPVLQVPYISYFEFPERSGETDVNEISLWSLRYGFLIGEDLNEISQTDTASLVFLLENCDATDCLLYSLDTAPGILKSLMNNREVNEIRLFPVQSFSQGTGFFVLWGRPPAMTLTDEICLRIISDIVGQARTLMRYETDLARIEEKFRGVIEDIGDMYYHTDKAGNILEISPSMASALQYTPSELVGKSLENFLQYPDVWPLFLSEVLHENGVKDYELVFKGNRGRIITGSVSCRLIYDEEGCLLGSEGVIRDISRRKQYEQLVQESEWKLEQAQKIAKLGVWSYDSESRLFRVSSEIFSILNIHAEKSFITLDDLVALSATGDKTKFSLYFDQMVRGGNEFGFEFRIDLPDEKFKHIRIKGQPRIRGGIVTGSFGIIQDITERKEVEQHLLKYAYQLEQKTLELDAMRTQLLDMNRELDQRVRRRTNQIEELLRQKDEFIVQIGHDLKTPLTPLVAILPLIRKRITDPEIGELLDISIEDVQSIKKMIVTILELARMNSLYTVSDLRDINLYDALDQLISDNAYLIHQKSLLVKNIIPPDLSVRISPMHFETLMTNLIGNAVKYSYIEGEITISGYERGESVVVVIRDQGIGIEPEILPRIFDTFFKADSSRHDRESHGLGLSIAQRVADIYGGIIRAESEGTGKGSTFSVHLKKNPQIKSFSVMKKEEG